MKLLELREKGYILIKGKSYIIINVVALLFNN
jgi:hypothetical protein